MDCFGPAMTLVDYGLCTRYEKLQGCPADCVKDRVVNFIEVYEMSRVRSF